MTFEQIIAVLAASLPSVSAIAGIVLATIKAIRNSKVTSKQVMDKFEEVRQEIFNTKEYSELKDELVQAHQENIELKQIIRKLVDKIDHMYSEEN